MIEDYKEQFENMSKGDKIYVEHQDGFSVETFVRTTKTLLVTINKYEQETKYDIVTGEKKGLGRWEYVYAQPFTEKHEKIVNKHRIYKLASKKLRDIKDKMEHEKFLTEDLLEKLDNILEISNE